MRRSLQYCSRCLLYFRPLDCDATVTHTTSMDSPATIDFHFSHDSSHHDLHSSSPPPSIPLQLTRTPTSNSFITTWLKYGKKRVATLLLSPQSAPPEKPKVFDAYEVFGQARNTLQSTLKKTCQRQIIGYHPDRHIAKFDKERGEEKAADLNRAWNDLVDPENGAIYDEFGYTNAYNIEEELRKKRECSQRGNSAN